MNAGNAVYDPDWRNRYDDMIAIPRKSMFTRIGTAMTCTWKFMYTPLPMKTAGSAGMIGYQITITGRKKMKEALRRISVTDDMTKL